MWNRSQVKSDSSVWYNVRPDFTVQKAQWHCISIWPVRLSVFQNNLYLRVGVCTDVSDGVGVDKVGTENNNNNKTDALLSKAILENPFYLQAHQVRLSVNPLSLFHKVTISWQGKG